MNEAIYYINKNSTEPNSTEPNPAESNIIDFTDIPEQAIDIVIGKVLNKQTLLTGIAKACDFPAYFGHNWDALWDCLTDTEIKYLKLDLTGVAQINTEDFKLFKSIIEDAYEDFGQPQLWVLV